MQLQLSINDEDLILFKRTIRKLLESTFILKDKDRKLYYYLARESNRLDVSDYLRMIGYDVFVDERTEIAMLVVNEEDAETVGLKRANIVTFSPLQYHMLLCLWEIYLENLGLNEAVYIGRGDLIDKMKAYLTSVSSSELKAAFRLFKKYSFIDYDENDPSEGAPIRLYASLQFGWDLDQFRTVASEYLERAGQEGADRNGNNLPEDEPEEDEPEEEEYDEEDEEA